MQLIAAVGSHTGIVRKNNEDNFCFDGMVMPEKNDGCDIYIKKMSDEKVHLLGVFDGMGGHEKGEVAAYLAADISQKHTQKLSEGDLGQQLTQLCLEANDAICEATEGSMMGTTAAMVCFRGYDCMVCNVGDSPIFLYRKGELTELSLEHTQRAMYEQTTGKKAEPGTKFKLTQCLGIPKDEMIIEPYCAKVQIRPDDIFLICSDGLTDMVTPEQIREVLGGTEGPDEMVFKLTHMALDAGGRDNITSICICIRGEVPLAHRAKAFLQDTWKKVSAGMKKA